MFPLIEVIRLQMLLDLLKCLNFRKCHFWTTLSSKALSFFFFETLSMCIFDNINQFKYKTSFVSLHNSLGN